MKKAEKDILLGCLHNDHVAQKALYDKYKIPMYRLCLRYANDEPEAADMLQEGFIKVFQDISSYSGKGALGGWIRTVITRAALQLIRRRSKIIGTEELNGHEQDLSKTAEVLDNLSAEEILALIKRLPQGYRTVFNLFVIEGYSHREISEMLGIDINTSKSQLSKARARLRECYLKQVQNYL